MPLYERTAKRIAKKEREDELGISVIKAAMKESGDLSEGRSADESESESEGGSESEEEDDEDDGSELSDEEEDESGDEDDGEEASGMFCFCVFLLCPTLMRR